MDNYQQLHRHFTSINDLEHVLAITGWDEASMMPPGGGAARGQAMATLEVVLHGMVTDARVRDWLEAAGEESLDDWQSANLREMSRAHRDATCIPADLVAAKRKATSASEQAWRTLRADNDWPGMLPLLQEVVNLSRQEAAARAAASGLGLYDALLDTYEPDVTSAQLDSVFDDLKGFLPGFVEKVLDKQSAETVLPVEGNFSVERQRQLGEKMMGDLGFDFEHGRLDVSHHPFCGGVPDDVRITTRYYEDSYVHALMAVIHETGHAMYEQGLPVGWRDQPVGRALSCGTHESQSLIFEMQACRSREFLHYLAPLAQRAFLGAPSDDPAWGEDNLHRLYTRVNRSYIRVDADEATYPLHVILRYEIEKDLIEGRLEVTDIPDAWNVRMQDYLSLSTTGNYRDGCMQDVHWAAGLFGYFPTYTLGALTAAQLFATAEARVGGLREAIATGDFAPLRSWLREHVHGRGKYLPYNDMMREATGGELDAGYFKKHLASRYLPG